MASKGVMRDSYIGGIANASFIPDSTGYHPNQLVTPEEEPVHDVIKRQPASSAWDTANVAKAGNQTDEDKMIRLSYNDDVKVTNINKTEEYNVGYVGLSILPWEDFVFNPRSFNELFFLESNNRITYDPDEVNTFFHGKNVMPPSVGDISENGKSWNIVVENLADLRKVRTWLTERCSVFGVTLLYKEKRFQKPKRAPCLVMLDPNKGMLGDKLYTTITRAMDSLHNRRRFCVEINLNACVERWCKRVLMTDCQVVGGKLVITNGEEYLAMDGIEDKVCCVVCFPIWALQTGIYKLHRTVVYDDFKVTFDADDLFLHGTFQDSGCQRRQIFTASKDESVFRTRSAAQTDLRTLQDLGSFKFVAVKRYEKADEDETYDETISRVAEHNTTTFGELVEKRKEKILIKEKKLNSKQKDGQSAANYDSKGENQTVGMNNHASNVFPGYKELKLPTEKESTKAERERQETDTSDNEYDIGFKIPEVASVLCDDDEDKTSYKKIGESNVHNNTESLFSPGAHHNLVCKESITGAKASFKNTTEFSDNLEDVKDGVRLFDNNSIEDTEDESSDSDTEDTCGGSNDVVKDDLLNEMLQIEKTLPSLRKGSVHTAKDVKDLKETEANNRVRKKKNRERPGVKKALKDLMKTTKAKKDVLPSATDEKYQEVSSKIKQEKVKTVETPKTGLSAHKEVNNQSPKSDKSDLTNVSIPSNLNDSVRGGNVISDKEKETVNTEDDVTDVVSFVNDNPDTEDSKKTDVVAFDECRSSPDGANVNGQTLTNTLADLDSSDGSSTDGDDVEMIYQSSPGPTKRKSGSLFLRDDDVVQHVARRQDIDDNGLDELSLFNASGPPMKTGGEKSKRLSKSPMKSNKNLDRNEMFQKTNKSHVRRKSKDVVKPIDVPTVTKSLDIDMEVTDFDLEDDVRNETVVKSMDAMESDLSLKLDLRKGSPKKQKRGVNRYNSNRKYLGASVPPKQTRNK